VRRDGRRRREAHEWLGGVRWRRRIRRRHGRRLDAPALLGAARRRRRQRQRRAVVLAATRKGRKALRNTIADRHGRRALLVARLDDERVETQRNARAAARRHGPVQGPDRRVTDVVAILEVARPDVTHALRAHGHRATDWQRVAHDRLLLRREARYERDARRRRRQRRRARRPLDTADVLARRAVLGQQRLDLVRAAVDAHRDKGVHERLAVRSDGRQRLGDLERDGRVVAPNELGVHGRKELVAVADQERLEDLVELVQRVPDALVELDAHRQLAAALAR